MKVWFNAPGSSRLVSFHGVKTDLSRALTRRGIEVVRRPEDKPDVQINIGHPEPLRRTTVHYARRAELSAWYFVCEADRIPPGWVDVIRDHSDLVLTPSVFCMGVLRRAWCELPTHLVPHGIEPNDWPLVTRPPARPWTFLWIGDRYPVGRKNGDLVERAFVELGLPDARLIVKWVPVFSAEYVEAGFDSKWIRRQCEFITRADLAMLYASADVFVWPTVGEGFGIPPLEAGATGLPVIVTNWGGCLDYLHSSDCYLLRCKESQDAASTLGFAEDARAAEVDYEHLKELMARTYWHGVEARALGRAFADRVRRDWTWDHAAQRLLEALETAGVHV